MPDPTLKTVSATEAPGLFNVSPYVTRWMLYKHFADGMDLEVEPNARMDWGKKLQPLIIEQAAQDLHLEVRANPEDAYVRRGLLGCTRDAIIICPDRGPGALETKCVFDYRTWMADWAGGKQPPRHHEIQLQQQMLVGNGEQSYQWGVLGAWVAGEVHYFEREPITDLWQKINDEALMFFKAVASKDEPDPFGATVELPWLNAMFPTVRGNALDLTEHPEGPAYVEATVAYRNAKEQEAAGKRTAEPLRAKLLSFVKDHDEVLLPDGVKINVTPVHNGKRLKVYVPDGRATLSPNSIPDDILMAG